MRAVFPGLIFISFLHACAPGNHETSILPDVPDGVQALSLTGNELRSPPPSESVEQAYERARETHLAQPDRADHMIWYGRWTAYKGDYREAIRIYTQGIRNFPGDARFYRHRGHRYISIRAFDRAIADFEKAVQLIEGTEDEVEPDGMPNALNIPVSTLHTNIWYHLGLARYLNHDYEEALHAYRNGVNASRNDDMLVAHTHWLYMTLRILERDEEAKSALEPIHHDMNVIENQAYYQLCQMYKGLISIEELAGDTMPDTMGDALKYGFANWHAYNGDVALADSLFDVILEGQAWASFGHIAAEAHNAIK